MLTDEEIMAADLLCSQMIETWPDLLEEVKVLRAERALLVALAEAADELLTSTNPLHILSPRTVGRCRASLLSKLDSWRAHTEARGR